MSVDFSDPTHVMTIDEFMLIACKLSENPWDRITPETKEDLLEGDPMFDIHCHLFDVKTINFSYLFKRFLDPEQNEKIKLLVELLGTDTPAKALINPDYANRNSTLNQLAQTLDNTEVIEKGWKDICNGVDYALSKKDEGPLDWIDFWEVFKHLGVILSRDMEGVYDYYMRKFALTGHRYRSLDLNKKTMVITAIMMDLEQGWAQGAPSQRPINTVIEDLHKLAESEPILPYFSVDPNRAHDSGYLNLYRLFLQAFPTEPEKTSFFGVKAYPALGYLPSDPRLDPIFQICEEKNIPVLTHCGGPMINSGSTQLTVHRGSEEVTFSGTPEEIANMLNHPGEWLPVLQKYPNLKLNLAHWGSIDGWTNYEQEQGPTDDAACAALTDCPQDKNEWVNAIKYLCRTYDNVYTDFSFALVDRDLYPALKTSLEEDPKLGKKLLYGTDFWVAIPREDLIQAQKNFLTYFKGYREQLLVENPMRYLFGNSTAEPHQFA